MSMTVPQFLTNFKTWSLSLKHESIKVLQQKGLCDNVFNIDSSRISFLTNNLNCQVALFTGNTGNCVCNKNIYYLKCILSRFCWHSLWMLCTTHIICSSLTEVFELKQITFGLFTDFRWDGTKPHSVIHILLQSHINSFSKFHTVKTEKYLLHVHFGHSSHTAWAQSWWIYK